MAHLGHSPLPELVGLDDTGFVALADEVVEAADTDAAIAAPAERYGCACGIVLAAHHRDTVRVLFGQHNCFHDILSLRFVIPGFEDLAALRPCVLGQQRESCDSDESQAIHNFFIFNCLLFLYPVRPDLGSSGFRTR